MGEGSWYYVQNGGEAGPVSTDALRGMLASGQLSTNDFVWHEGMAEWSPAASVPELAVDAAPGAAPSAMPPPMPAAPYPPQPGWPQPLGYQGYPAYQPMHAPPDPRRKKAESAAKASWLAVIVAVVLNFAISSGRAGRGGGYDRMESTLSGLFSFGIYTFGLICGIYALTQVRRFGPQGIRTPAIVGIVLNGLILAGVAAAIVFMISSR